ncbi:hypothetical protein GCM10022221_64000 [Actinocorallia aurea]
MPVDLRLLADQIGPLLDTLGTWAVPLVAAPPATVDDRIAGLARPEAALLLHGLTEKVVKYHSTNPDPTGGTPTLDDFAEVELEIFGPDGEPLGRTAGAGRMLYRRESDGHFIAYFGERIELLDGNVIRAGGLVDDALLTEGEAAGFPAVVVDGPLRGAIGFRQFRPLKDAHTTYASSIVLYRA